MMNDHNQENTPLLPPSNNLRRTERWKNTRIGTDNSNSDDASEERGSAGKQQQRNRRTERGTNNNNNNNNNTAVMHSMTMIPIGPIIGVSKPIEKWYRGLVVRQSCHNHLASDLLSKDMYLNTLSVALTAITSSAIFTSLSPTAGATTAMQNNPHGDLNNTQAMYNVGGVDQSYYYAPIDLSNTLAVIAGVIAALNTVLQGVTRTLYYGQRGERHLRAYKEFSRLRFQLESIVGDKPKYTEHKVDREKLKRWIRKYEEALEESPIIPQKTFEHVAKEQGMKSRRWPSDEKELEAIMDEERNLAAVKESKMV